MATLQGSGNHHALPRPRAAIVGMSDMSGMGGRAAWEAGAAAMGSSNGQQQWRRQLAAMVGSGGRRAAGCDRLRRAVIGGGPQ
jgi:hypothetical protein